MKLSTIFAATVAATCLFAGSASADVVTYNTAPTDPYDYGSGNNYAPSNSGVLRTTAGDELALRFHETFQTAPASVGKNYYFTLGAGKQLSFDWLIDTTGTGGFDDVTAVLTLTNINTGGVFSYNPLGTPDNRPVQFDSLSNSARVNWFAVPLLGFDTAIDGTYNAKLEVNGLIGGPKSFDINAVFGAGSAVPEPATWAMMIIGFGGVGSMVRANRRRQVLVLA